MSIPAAFNFTLFTNQECLGWEFPSSLMVRILGFHCWGNKELFESPYWNPVLTPCETQNYHALPPHVADV